MSSPPPRSRPTVELRPLPAYRALLESGALSRLAVRLAADLSDCRLCPRRCGVDRVAEPAGRCRTGALARVDAAFPHFGEEPCLVGRGGSGTVFFAGCGLGCLYCQNASISHGGAGREVTADELADRMLTLQDEGCENVNLVTPTHVVPQWVDALERAARRGLRLPLVHNTGGYEDAGTLRRLHGVVDVYLPDLKTLDAKRAARWFDAPDYPEVARAALREMHRQVGPLVIDDRGVAVRGLIVRHLVMPGATRDALDVLEFLASLGPGTAVSILAQYRPLARAGETPGIARRPSPDEVRAVEREALRLHLRIV
jgi:putative pyruvate formate lyase activating enzyme